MIRTKIIALTLLIFTLAVTGCGNASTSTPELNIAPTIVPTSIPTQEQTPVVILKPTQIPNRLPASEADVPRVSVGNAKAAFDNGKAIIVDVRSRQVYDISHIAGAIFIPLADIESNSVGSVLSKDQWIITYCT